MHNGAQGVNMGRNRRQPDRQDVTARIAAVLQADGSMAIAKLADRVVASESGVMKRLMAFESAGWVRVNSRWVGKIQVHDVWVEVPDLVERYRAAETAARVARRKRDQEYAKARNDKLHGEDAPFALAGAWRPA